VETVFKWKSWGAFYKPTNQNTIIISQTDDYKTVSVNALAFVEFYIKLLFL
jgi:hypothetical protein